MLSANLFICLDYELLIKVRKGIKCLLEGAEDIERGHQIFSLLLNGPLKIFADS